MADIVDRLRLIARGKRGSCEDAAEAASEIERLRRTAGEWLPIERAPRDGTPQIVGYWHKGIWVTRIAKANSFGKHLRWLTAPGDWHVTPTHFLLDAPTPPPPENGNG